MPTVCCGNYREVCTHKFCNNCVVYWTQPIQYGRPLCAMCWHRARSMGRNRLFTWYVSWYMTLWYIIYNWAYASWYRDKSYPNQSIYEQQYYSRNASNRNRSNRKYSKRRELRNQKRRKRRIRW